MAWSIQRTPRGTRRRLQRVVQRSGEHDHVGRAMALLRLAQGLNVSEKGAPGVRDALDDSALA